MRSIGVVARVSRLAIPALCCCLTYSAVPILDLLKQSDLVVIASPTAFHERERGVQVDLSVIQWLTSTAQTNTNSVQLLWDASVQERQWFESGGKSGAGIWFLKDRGDGMYSALRVVGPKPPLGLAGLYLATPDRESCPSALAYPADSPVSEKIALELACSATKQTGDYFQVSGSMVSAIRGIASTSTRVRDACMYLAQLPSSTQKAIGAACLIDAGDVAGVLLLEQHLQELSNDDVQRIIAGKIMAWRKADPVAVASIGRIAASPHATGALLFGASLALCEIHTRGTLPYLRRLLDSSDRAVQANATRGFIAFVSGRPIATKENFANGEYTRPSRTPYSDDPSWRKFGLAHDASDDEAQAAVAFWKHWLQAHPELPQ